MVKTISRKYAYYWIPHLTYLKTPPNSSHMLYVIVNIFISILHNTCVRFSFIMNFVKFCGFSFKTILVSLTFTLTFYLSTQFISFIFSSSMAILGREPLRENHGFSLVKFPYYQIITLYLLTNLL
jgi:hypothetical protein